MPDATALIMAGGRSERMRATAGGAHKSLVPLLGEPMLQRNLRNIISQGFRDIVIAISAFEPDVERFVHEQAAPLAEAHGTRVRCFKEMKALGNIGAAREIQAPSGTTLVTYVDNFSTINLSNLVAHHNRQGADFTIATHHESFDIPYGEVAVTNGAITAYIEKPVHHVHVSSGIFVLSNPAREAIPSSTRVDARDLFTILRANNRKILAFEHDALWIDVNDAQSVSRAERLFSQYFGTE